MQYFLPNKNFPVLQAFPKPHTSALFPIQIPAPPNLCGLTCPAVNTRSPLPTVTINQCVEGEEGLAMIGKPSGHSLRPVKSREDWWDVHFFWNNSPISMFFHSEIPCLLTLCPLFFCFLFSSLWLLKCTMSDQALCVGSNSGSEDLSIFLPEVELTKQLNSFALREWESISLERDKTPILCVCLNIVHITCHP